MSPNLILNTQVDCWLQIFPLTQNASSLKEKKKQSIHQTEQLKGRSQQFSLVAADQKEKNTTHRSRSHSENKVHLTLVSGTMD